MKNFAEKYGPWAVIAGASEGTGRAFAHRVAAEGLNCILIARREAPLQALSQQLQSQYGNDCLSIAMDLAAEDAVDRITAAVGDREVGLYISNAGADPYGSRFLDTGIDDWVGLINRNVHTVVRCCHHFARQMRERKRGGIVLVGSGSCYGGASHMAVYAGAKAFDLCFGEGLWTELRPYGVDVLNLILGRTDTPAFRELLTEKGLPVPEDLASPEDVAAVGLERLPHGPVHNWGQDDDEAGFAPTSAATRRTRIQFIDAATKDVFGDH
jgi:short-subunit dehydrogenase